MLDATGIPYALMAGNHENTEALRAVFADARRDLCGGRLATAVPTVTIDC